MKVNKACTTILFLLALGLLQACTYPVRPSDRPFIDELIRSSNSLIETEEFRELLSSVPAVAFDHSSDGTDLRDDDGSKVLAKLQLAHTHDVICRRAKWPLNFSTNAWEGGGTPQLRCSRLHARSTAQWIGTLIHERAHASGYQHSGNARLGNECTVPHFVGDLATFLASAKKGNAPLPKDVCPALRSALEQSVKTTANLSAARLSLVSQH